jgi:hypothetical protein
VRLLFPLNEAALPGVERKRRIRLHMALRSEAAITAFSPGTGRGFCVGLKGKIAGILHFWRVFKDAGCRNPS